MYNSQEKYIRRVAEFPDAQSLISILQVIYQAGLAAMSHGYTTLGMASRLGFGMERRFAEDKLLDYMIGLESLYLPDGNDELTFKLSLRVAFILNQEITEGKKTYQFMKKMYRQRSKIAHGRTNELTKEDLSCIEELLRRSLKLYAEHPDTFTPASLDNIYFAEG